MSILSTPWKLATIAAGVLNLVIGGFLVSSHFENKALSKQRDQLQMSITDPKTGFVARLTQAQNNVVTLETALAKQNAALQTLSKESAAQLAATRRELAIAQRESARAQARVNAFLNTKIEGKTLEERVIDVDKRAMEEFLGEE